MLFRQYVHIEGFPHGSSHCWYRYFLHTDIFAHATIIQSIDMVYLPILGHFCYLSITGEGSSQKIYKISFYNKFYLILKSFWGFTKVIIIVLFHKVYILNFHYWNRHTMGVFLNILFIQGYPERCHNYLLLIAFGCIICWGSSSIKKIKNFLGRLHFFHFV